jgi:hypothetical protein
MTMIRARVVSGFVPMAAFAAALTPVTCRGDDSDQLPTRGTEELPLELLSLFRQKKMPFTGPYAHFQGRDGTRSVEAGHPRTYGRADFPALRSVAHS